MWLRGMPLDGVMCSWLVGWLVVVVVGGDVRCLVLVGGSSRVTGTLGMRNPRASGLFPGTDDDVRLHVPQCAAHVSSWNSQDTGEFVYSTPLQ